LDWLARRSGDRPAQVPPLPGQAHAPVSVNRRGERVAGSAADALDEEGNVRFRRKNEEDEQWHRSSTTDEASCVGDDKKTGEGC
jgi:hypothetical protein